MLSLLKIFTTIITATNGQGDNTGKADTEGQDGDAIMIYLFCFFSFFILVAIAGDCIHATSRHEWSPLTCLFCLFCLFCLLCYDVFNQLLRLIFVDGTTVGVLAIVVVARVLMFCFLTVIPS